MNPIMLGIYKHFKGARYEVIGFAKHTENLEDLVIYRAVSGKRETWCRPLPMFEEEIEVDGKTVKRFEYEG
jgi:hypothetical protein